MTGHFISADFKSAPYCTSMACKYKWSRCLKYADGESTAAMPPQQPELGSKDHSIPNQSPETTEKVP